MKSIRIMSIIGIVLAGLCLIGMPDENSTTEEAIGLVALITLYLLAFSIVALVQVNRAMK